MHILNTRRLLSTRVRLFVICAVYFCIMHLAMTPSTVGQPIFGAIISSVTLYRLRTALRPTARARCPASPPSTTDSTSLSAHSSSPTPASTGNTLPAGRHTSNLSSVCSILFSVCCARSISCARGAQMGSPPKQYLSVIILIHFKVYAIRISGIFMRNSSVTGH